MLPFMRRNEPAAGKIAETKSMENILKVVQNRYESIRVMAKEARRVNNLLRRAGEELEEKPTSIAMKRVIDGKVKFEYEEPEGEQ